MSNTSTHYNIYSLDLENKIRFWYKRFKFWSTIYWITGILGLSVLALSVRVVLPECYQRYLPGAAIMVLGFIAFANPNLRAARFMRAYLILEPALRDYRAKLISPEQLTSIHRQAEEALHGTGVIPNPSPVPSSANSSSSPVAGTSEGERSLES